jgi:hypothetical protein
MATGSKGKEGPSTIRSVRKSSGNHEIARQVKTCPEIRAVEASGNDSLDLTLCGQCNGLSMDRMAISIVVSVDADLM